MDQPPKDWQIIAVVVLVAFILIMGVIHLGESLPVWVREILIPRAEGSLPPPKVVLDYIDWNLAAKIGEARALLTEKLKVEGCEEIQIFVSRDGEEVTVVALCMK